MKAMIISIGDELLLGQTVDSNSAWLSGEFAGLGVRVVEHITVGDDVDVIAGHLLRAGGQVDVIVVTGGLGPTEDDLTRHAVAKVLGVELRLHRASMERIEGFFRKLNRKPAGTNRIQAMIPQNCEVIENPVCTAPGIRSLIGGARAYFLPGVPAEMRKMFDETVRSELRQAAAGQGGNNVIIGRSLHVFGTGESNVAELLGEMMARGRNPLVNCTASNGIISVRIISEAADEGAAGELIAPVEKELRLGLFDISSLEGTWFLCSGLVVHLSW